MSGKDLYDFVHAFGYSEYIVDTGLPDSLKPAPKSLDWLFAFPKMSKFLKWLLNDCPKSQIFSYSAVKSFTKLPLKVPLSRFEELNDLLDPEPHLDTQVPDYLLISVQSTQQELKSLISEQDAQIKSLESQLEQADSLPYDEKIIESVEIENQELEHCVLQYLEQFSEVCPIASLQAVQSYLKIDEDLTEKVLKYCNLVDLCLQAIDSSVFQRYLRSDRGDEFTSLCMVKQELDQTTIQTHKQLVLASAALEKTRVTLKTFEKLLNTQLHPENPDAEISAKSEELSFITEETIKTLQAIEQTTKNLQTLDSSLSHLDDLELILKKNDFSQRKLTEIKKILLQQRGTNLLGLTSILAEMSKVQSEYDKLFNIQNFFSDISSQSEFRLSYYPKYKLRSDILSNEIKTIDERNEFFNKVGNIVGIGQRATYEEVFMAIGKVKMLAEMKKKANEENLQNFEREGGKVLFEVQKVLNEIRERVLTKEGIEEGERIMSEVWEMEEQLVEFVKKFELANEEVVVGDNGLTERDIFIEYLLSTGSGDKSFSKFLSDIVMKD